MRLDKFTPKYSKGIIGNHDQIKKFRDWLQGQRRRHKACLLHGIPGIGKTLTVYLVGQEEGFTILETNASDVRTKGALRDIQDSVRTIPLGGNKLLFLFDEADGMHAWAQFEKMIEASIHPIVLTANEPYRIPERVKKKCKTIKMYSPRKQDILDHLKKIAEAEKLQFEYNKITDDVRQNLLTMLNKSDSYQLESIFDDVRDIFFGKAPERMDSNLAIWLLDNASSFLSGRPLYEFLQALILADRTGHPEILGRVSKNLSGSVSYPYYYQRIKVLGGKK